MKYTPYKKFKKDVINIISTVIFVLICIPILFSVGVMFYCNFALEYYPIVGTSMQPLLNAKGVDEDYVYTTKNTSDITYGDLIIYKYIRTNTQEEVLIIKRVIAMGGDNIKIKDTGVRVPNTANNYYSLYIQYNGQGEWVELCEDYIANKEVYRVLYSQFYFENTLNKTFLTDQDGDLYIHLEEDEIFYLGDNRLASTDCIDYGPRNISGIIGEVKYLIYGNTNRVWQIISQMLGFSKWK